MECKHCNAEIEENAKFCTKCGKTQSEETELSCVNEVKEELKAEEPKAEQAKAEKPKKKRSFVPLLEIIIGLIFVVIGIIGATSTSVSITSTSFGADFYTYCYRGIVNCANALSDINNSIGWLVAAAGFGLVFDGLKGQKK